MVGVEEVAEAEGGLGPIEMEGVEESIDLESSIVVDVGQEAVDDVEVRALAGGEIAPRLVDRRQVIRHLTRCREMPIHHGDVDAEPGPSLEPGVDPPARVAAGEVRAEVGDGLHCGDVVGVREQGEQVERMVRGDGDAPFVGPYAAENAGQGFFGLLPDSDGVPVPDAVTGQLGEIGEEVAQEVALRIDQGGHRELVEYQQHDGHRVLDLTGLGQVAGSGQCHIAGRGHEEEPGGEDGDGPRGVDGPGLHDREGEEHTAEEDPGAGDRRPEEKRGGVAPEQGDPGIGDEEGEERPDDDGVPYARRPRPDPAKGEDGEREQRGQDEQQGREQDDIDRGEATGDEELRIPPEEVEHGLSQGKRTHRRQGQWHRQPGRRAQPPRLHRGSSAKRILVPEERPISSTVTKDSSSIARNSDSSPPG